MTTRFHTRMLFLFLLAAFAASATGCGPSARERALSATLTGLNAARDGFVTWDDQHQQGIVDRAMSLEDGQARLAAYRQKREPVLHGFEIAYKALAVAAIDKRPETLAEAVQAARRVYDLIKTIMEAFSDAPASDPSPAE